MEANRPEAAEAEVTHSWFFTWLMLMPTAMPQNWPMIGLRRACQFFPSHGRRQAQPREIKIGDPG